MRTTVTLDKDVERLLRDTMHRTRKSFKETLNSTLRIALGGRPVQAKLKPFVVTARPMGLQTGIDPTGLNKLADDLDVDEFLADARGGETS